MDDDVRAYVEAIPPDHQALFDRVHWLVLTRFPDADVVMSYAMPTYKVGKHRLYVGAWKHGLSIYGWGAGHDGGFAVRHPELVSGKGTIRLRPDDAAGID